MISDVIKKTWPLFLGVAFLMLGNGLQGTLVSWRASHEGFLSSTTAWIMTGYYVGFLTGSLSAQVFVARVGYIRVFAALASLASTAILIQIVFISAPLWFFMRVLTGFCFAGIYVIVESWLNAKATNKTRGSILSIYMVISFGGMALGQWLLNVADPASETLFILCSILLSLALVPILIVRTEAPSLESQASLSVLKAFKSSPAGILTIFVSAIAHGAMFGMGAVYAVEIGMSVADTVVFMSIFIAMGALFQWPIGWLSDQIDRRKVIVLISVIALGLCVVLFTLEPTQTVFYIAYGGLGAMTLPIYSIAVAHTNDRLEPQQMAAASGTIILVMGVGSIFGPITSGYLLNFLGAPGYLIHIGVVHLVIILAVTYFMFRRDAVEEVDQTQYQVVPPRTTGVALEAIAQEAEESMGSETER